MKISAFVLTLCVAAQTRAAGFDVQLLRPAPDLVDPYFALSSAHPAPALYYSAGLFLDYAKNPLVLNGADGKRLARLVDHQLTGHVAASLSVTERIGIGLVMPLVLHQSGEDVSFVTAAPRAGFGTGDLRVLPRFVLYRGDSKGTDNRGFALHILADVSVPTGKVKKFQGEGFRVEPKLGGEMVFKNKAHLGASLGYAIRPKAELLNVDVNDMLTWDVGGAYPVSRAMALIAEVHGGVSVLAKKLATEEVPLELLLGAKGHAGRYLTLMGGGGMGLVSGVSAPDWRIFAGLALHASREESGDSDGDGLKDDVDACPAVPEDVDAFEDQDGCPEPDNDRDGLADTQDACPNEPEDVDAFDDQDGCPDLDNDKDGVIDTKDACPIVAEDSDGFEDDDGCPDPDNDKDGILDPNDKCPIVAEDTDGIQDDDGCPETDADGDSIEDPSDKCPTTPETLNGVNDTDGCPDSGGKVLVTCAKIEIKEKVFFDTGKSTIQQRSNALLNQVAAVLQQAKHLKRLRIEGHTDDRGNDDKNMALSRSRADAVRDYLIAQGVEGLRLEAEGLGETKPLATNKTARGREQNRRVEFFIVEQETNPNCTSQ